MTCSCISYNQPEPWQKAKSVVLVPPFPSKPAVGPEIPHPDVCIDACIVPAIKALWDAGIYTKSSCCGHNRVPPSIVLSDNASRGLTIDARLVIAGVDGRHFELYSWTFTKL